MARLLTTDDVADLLHTTPERVRRLAHARKITWREEGRFMRFTQADVDAYLEAIEQPAESMGTISRTGAR